MDLTCLAKIETESGKKNKNYINAFWGKQP